MITLKTGKKLEVPFRMFRLTELEDMGVDSVEGGVYFNKIKFGERATTPSEEIRKNMAILTYVDCTNIPYSFEALQKAVADQNNSGSDFKILPCFKDETEYDSRQKIEYAETLKNKSEEDVIFELKYDSNMNDNDLADGSYSFDFLAIHYGVHFGRYPSFEQLSGKMAQFKKACDKEVFCIGVPLIFSADKNSYLMPIWGLICDGWVRCWRPGGECKEIKLIDYKDRKNKNEIEWLRTGHRIDEYLPQINATVYEIFREGKSLETLRAQYRNILVDEAFEEINALTPTSIESYAWDKIPAIYHPLIIGLYREKLLSSALRRANWLKQYQDDEKRILENDLRGIFSPALLNEKIEQLHSLILTDKKIPVETLLTELNRTQKQ